MQPKARHAYVPGLAALLAVAVTGCSGGGAGDGSASDSKPGGPTSATVAQPGKYRTLREACGTVPRATIKEMLPGTATLPETQQTKAYRGTPSVTYDTDRRVGCSWKADAPDASHQLVIDLERVVSYDPAVSDADRAQEVYAKQETAADLPIPGSGDGAGDTGAGDTGAGDTGGTGGTDSPARGPSDGSPSATGTPSTKDSGSGSGSGSGTATASSGAPGTSGTSSTSAGLEPRVLDGLGDAAFLDDALTRSGSATQRRTVSVVFRTSNVIVTVRYSEQPARSSAVPDSEELQAKARGLARKLVDQLNA
ncbi:DUF3558 domain-containing protein [Streptomyces corynorhini]|uniref:DUF3558 domain-containing protein n=1 Tax=Streptomyces corynorhini TaxID=2282652 RepID=A0A370B834_9ACTN|nr:DUF3558 domain-containing protein [Streptomyces corynorhini]RDG35575.1 DUF3558 domain-containing protein [Streptomyces corynorhini]